MAGGIFGRLRAIAAAAASGAAGPPRELFVDEDEYGEIEVLPVANVDWCRAELRKIAAFAEAHEVPDGLGWTDIYMRPPAPRRLADLKIPLAPILAALRERLAPFDRVTSGSFHAPEPIATAHAFGSSPLNAIVVIANADAGTVQSILLVLREDGNAAADLMAALKTLPSSEPLIVIDWARGGLVQI
ncbi:MAG: hypothetical protein ABI391_01915 [Hyphomicrobiaceae bacterium]